ncbi:type II toxin-antitoxin system VapC family toxin [Moraxella lacunata]
MSDNCQRILLDENNHLCFSKASIWEISIKYSLGKPDFDYNPKQITQELLRLGFDCLEIEFSHLFEIGNLPKIHKDPFDRLLIVQAKLENLKLLTADNAILQYDKSFILNTQSL